MIVLGLALGVSVGNAFARFAYGLILPAMQSDLEWSYAQSGWINTANALGYIAGASATLALVCMVTGAATLGPVFSASVPGLTLSAFCFGLAVFMGPGAITNFGRKNLPPILWAQSVVLFTLIFAIGQTIGPVAAGIVGDVTGTLRAGLVAAGAILLLAAAIAVCQKPLKTTCVA